MRALVVSAKFLFRTANIVLTSRREAEQARNTEEPVQDQYQDGGLLYLLAQKFAMLYCRDSPEQMFCRSGFIGYKFLGKRRAAS